MVVRSMNGISMCLSGMCMNKRPRELYFDPEYEVYTEAPLLCESIKENDDTYSEYYNIWLSGRYSLMANEVLKDDNGKTMRHLHVVVYNDGSHTFKDEGVDDWWEHADWTWRTVLTLRPDMCSDVYNDHYILLGITSLLYSDHYAYQYDEAWKYDEEYWEYVHRDVKRLYGR
jgi:hypothetical protein